MCVSDSYPCSHLHWAGVCIQGNRCTCTCQSGSCRTYLCWHSHLYRLHTHSGLGSKRDPEFRNRRGDQSCVRARVLMKSFLQCRPSQAWMGELGSVWSCNVNRDATNSERFHLSLRFPPNITVATLPGLSEGAGVNTDSIRPPFLAPAEVRNSKGRACWATLWRSTSRLCFVSFLPVFSSK